ncbi:MAG: transcriptional regulator, TetR family, partial [Frankiales bacterium]|nr:transcriptional regulator, TetR family [Frankiales bacterium]
AGVSVGSLYQFFPDLAAVLQALARRSFDRYRSGLSARLAASPPERWQDLVEQVVDTYVAFARDEPGFRLLNLGGPLGVRSGQAYDNGLVAGALGEVLVEVLPEVSRSEALDRGLRVAVESGEAVLALAFRRDPAGDPALVAELKRFLVAGLADLLPAAERLPG